MDYSVKGIIEELEIMTVFNHEMNENGYKDNYSFYESVDNGYYIYVNNGQWNVDLKKDGKVIYKKKYTNIYNLCLDILKELKISNVYFEKRMLRIPCGTRVIINNINEEVNSEINEGIIIENNKRCNNRYIYKVLGDDGKEYCGLYGLNNYTEIYFCTMEDYITDMNNQIEDNNYFIRNLHDINWDLCLKLNSLISQKEKYLEEKEKVKKKEI